MARQENDCDGQLVRLIIHDGLSSQTDTLQQLITCKFRNQSLNMIKYLQMRSDYMKFTTDYLGSNSLLSPFCPIEFMRDGRLFQNFPPDLFMIANLSTVLNYIPSRVYCVRDRQLLLKMVSEFNGMYIVASPDLKLDEQVIRETLYSKRIMHNILEFMPIRNPRVSNDHEDDEEEEEDEDECETNDDEVKFILECIGVNDCYMCGVSELFSSPSFMSAAISKSIDSFEYVPEELIDDEEWFLKTLEENKYVLMYLSERRRTQLFGCYMERFAEHIEKIERIEFKDFPPEIRNDKNMLLKILKENGMILSRVDESFRKDKEIVKQACLSNWKSFKYAHEDIRGDDEMILDLLNTCHSDILTFASAKLKSNPEFCYKCIVKGCAKTIFQEVPELGSNRDFIDKCLEYFNSQPAFSFKILEFVSESFRNDKKLVLKAIETNEKNYEYISPELKQDRDVILSMSKLTYLTVPDYLKSDKEFMRLLLKNTPHPTPYLNELDHSLLEDEEFINDCSRENPSILKHIPEEFMLKNLRKYICYLGNDIIEQNLHLLMECLKDNPNCFQNLDQDILSLVFSKDETYLDLFIQYLYANPNEYCFLNKEIQLMIYKKDRQVAIRSSIEYQYSFQRLCTQIKNDEEIALNCINTWDTCFQFRYLEDELICNFNFLMKGVQSCGFLYHYISQHMNDMEIDFNEEEMSQLREQALKQCGYISLDTIETIEIEEFNKLLAIRMNHYYSSDFYIPTYYKTLEYLQSE